MAKPENTVVAALVDGQRDNILQEWLAEIASTAAQGGRGGGGGTTAVQRNDAADLLSALRSGLGTDADVGALDSIAWQPLRDALEVLSKSGVARGASAAETANFVMALKRPLFSGLQASLAGDAAAQVGGIWFVSTLVDKMAQVTLASYQRSREEIIKRQQEELLELSTPVIKLWHGVLAVPMIGTLDSGRTQLVMESLLQRIVETGSEMAIIDITGVPTVDTLVAQHLLKTVTAIRLMGADCIISGVRQQIAQTIVHLGIDLKGVTTKATLADALALAMKRSGYVVTRPAA